MDVFDKSDGLEHNTKKVHMYCFLDTFSQEQSACITNCGNKSEMWYVNIDIFADLIELNAFTTTKNYAILNLSTRNTCDGLNIILTLVESTKFDSIDIQAELVIVDIHVYSWAAYQLH